MWFLFLPIIKRSSRRTEKDNLTCSSSSSLLAVNVRCASLSHLNSYLHNKNGIFTMWNIRRSLLFACNFYDDNNNNNNRDAAIDAATATAIIARLQHNESNHYIFMVLLTETMCFEFGGGMGLRCVCECGGDGSAIEIGNVCATLVSKPKRLIKTRECNDL